MQWASKRSEIEVLDLYMQITDVLVFCVSRLVLACASTQYSLGGHLQEDATAEKVIGAGILGQVRDQIGGLRAVLPEDVLDSLAMSPTRLNRYSKAAPVAAV